MPKRIGIARSILGAPFAEALRRRAGSAVAVVDVPPLHIAEQLRQGDLDGAFVSPWEHLACYPTHRIVPGAAGVSEGPSGLITLVFRQHTRTLARIAARSDAPAECALAQIVLAEKYTTKAEFQELTGTWEEALGNADAVLASDALAVDTEGVEWRIDLVDEWYDLTGLPYVHGFWVVRDGAFTDLSIFAPPENMASGVVRTAPSADDWNGLQEFYRLGYFHGIFDDLPDLRFTGPPQ